MAAAMAAMAKGDREARQLNVQSFTNTLYMMGLVTAMFLTTYYFEPPSHQFNLDQFPPATREGSGHVVKNATKKPVSPWYLIADRVLRIIDALELEQTKSKKLYQDDNGVENKQAKNRRARDASKGNNGPFSLLANRILQIFDLVGINHVSSTKNHDDNNDLGQPARPRDKRDLQGTNKNGGHKISWIISWADKLMTILDGIGTGRTYDDHNGVERKKSDEHRRQARKVPVSDPQTVQAPEVPSQPVTWREAIVQLIKTLGESFLGKFNYAECEKFDVFSNEFKDCLLSLKKRG